jgi:hypothetical protein
MGPHDMISAMSSSVIERCPHCGGELRRRPYVVNHKAFKAVAEALGAAKPDGVT